MNNTARHDFIPTTDAEFYEWAETLMGYLSEKKDEFGIAQAKFDALQMLYNDFDAKYLLASEPSTRTPVAVTEKREAREAFVAALRVFLKAYVTYNPSVSDGDRRAMGLPLHTHAHTPVPVPTTYPDFTLDSSVIRCLTIRFRDHDSERRGKPHGVQGAVIRWAMLDTPPVNVEELTNSVLDTASPHTLSFPNENRGAKVYVCMAWQNSKGEKGPWSEIVCGIVP